MADNVKYIVQNAGAATISYKYSKALGSGATQLAANTPVTLKGFKLNSNYFDTNQAIDNSFIIPLLNGGSIQITNDNTCGSLTVQCIRTGNSPVSGDIVSIASAQRTVSGGDSVGAEITVSFDFSNTTYTTTFFDCTVAQCKPLTLAGNDAPDYQVVFNYSHWTFA